MHFVREWFPVNCILRLGSVVAWAGSKFKEGKNSIAQQRSLCVLVEEVWNPVHHFEEQADGGRYSEDLYPVTYLFVLNSRHKALYSCEN